MRLLLATHAQTDWNVQGRIQGHTDIPLNDHGRRQAHALQQMLAGRRLDAIVASDLSRARETAAILAMPHALPPRLDPRLREMHFGRWEGKTYADLQASDADALAAWEANPSVTGPPAGERLSELAERLRACLDELPTIDAATILLVGHRGAMRVLVCVLLGLPAERQWDFHLDICSVSELLWTGTPASIVGMNIVTPIPGL